ncbi:MAG: hypothetical protein JWO60_509 [Frankiales bacterium]|nr:hypothetical protein [Frankiales bacterium]
MRRPVIALTAAAALLTAAGASSAATLSSRDAAVPPAVPSTPVTAPFASPNVQHVGTIPLEGVGVSMETRTMPDGQVRAFVSGAGGLSIYDATDPTAPELLGHLPFYNWENEDIAVSKDGKTAFLTEFQGTLYLHAVDVADPTLPTITGSLLLDGAHTVVCADEPCNYLFGSEGQTYDVTDRANPVRVPAGKDWGTLLKDPVTKKTQNGHNLHQDGQGYWIADTMPLLMFKQGKKADGTADPFALTKITDGVITKDTGYQHNNIRPNAENYKPRSTTDNASGLKDGELLLGNGETNFGPQCDGSSGAFSTWSMVGFEGKKTKGMTQVDVLRPVNGDYAAAGDPAINEMGCSGHWFTQRNADDGKNLLVAAAWYEHGTRFLNVDRSTGKIKQVGFYQPVRGAASEAFIMPTKKDGKDVVWTVDYHSGIDILVFDQKAPVATVAQTNASWLAKKGVTDSWATIMRELCKAGATGTTAAPEHAAMHTAVKATGLATFPQLARLS